MDLNQKTILIPMIGQLSLKTTIKIFPSKGDILLNFNQGLYWFDGNTNLPEWHCLETGEVLVLRNFVCDTSKFKMVVLGSNCCQAFDIADFLKLNLSEITITFLCPV